MSGKTGRCFRIVSGSDFAKPFYEGIPAVVLAWGVCGNGSKANVAEGNPMTTGRDMRRGTKKAGAAAPAFSKV